MGVWRTDYRVVWPLGKSGHCSRFRSGLAGRGERFSRTADGAKISRLAHSAGQTGFRTAHWDFVAPDLRLVSSGSRWIWNLLRHFGLSNDSCANGAAGSAVEEFECAK